MNRIKDMSDLRVSDPAGFESHVGELIAGATPSYEYEIPASGGNGSAKAKHEPPLEPEATEPPIFDPEAARVTLERLDALQEPVRFIVAGLLPSAAGAKNGPGGTGKTTEEVNEDVHIILGRDLYGHEISRAGPVVCLTQEDDRAKLTDILRRIVDQMGLSRGERERVAESFYIEDLENRRVRFVESDRQGNLYQTSAVDQFIDKYGPIEPSQVVVDPFIFFSAGERHMNDGASELMLVGRKISRALNCGVKFIHHCSIATSRDKTDDMYAGRSAAAIADNARFVHNLWRYAPADGEKFGTPPPPSVSMEDIAAQRLLVLKAPKISDAPPVTEPIWILRQGWKFTHIVNEERSRDEIDRENARRVCEFVTKEEQRQVWYTTRSLEDAHADVGIPRNRLRALITLCEQKAWLIRQIIPEDHPFRHAKRTHRLTVGLMP